MLFTICYHIHWQITVCWVVLDLAIIWGAFRALLRHPHRGYVTARIQRPITVQQEDSRLNLDDVKLSNSRMTATRATNSSSSSCWHHDYDEYPPRESSGYKDYRVTWYVRDLRRLSCYPLSSMEANRTACTSQCWRKVGWECDKKGETKPQSPWSQRLIDIDGISNMERRRKIERSFMFYFTV